MRDYERLMAYWPRRLRRESERKMGRVLHDFIPRYLLGEDLDSSVDEAIVRPATPVYHPASSKKPPVSDHGPQQSERIESA